MLKLYDYKKRDGTIDESIRKEEGCIYTPHSTPNERVSSNAYILRALFCEVARPRCNVHIYLQNDTSARVCRCHDSSSEHIQEPNYSTEFPLYTFPHPIAFSPGAAVAVVARFLWVGLSCQSIRVASRA